MGLMQTLKIQASVIWVNLWNAVIYYFILKLEKKAIKTPYNFTPDTYLRIPSDTVILA